MDAAYFQSLQLQQRAGLEVIDNVQTPLIC